MTKSKRLVRGRRRARQSPTMRGIVSLPFRDVTTIPRTTATGYEISEIDLAIASFQSTSPVKVMAALFENFRVRKLRVHAFSDSMGVGASISTTNFQFFGLSHALGFIPESNALYGTATSYQDVLQLPAAKVGSAAKQLSLSLGKNILGHEPYKWFQTATTGTPPNGSVSPGSITYATHSLSGQTTNCMRSYVIMEGIIEFTNPVASGLAQLQPVVRQEEKELRIAITEEDFDHHNPRTSGHEGYASRISSVPNTPRSSTGSLATVSNEPMSARSFNGQFDRPRLVRQ